MVLGAVFRGSKSPAKSNGGIVIGVLRKIMLHLGRTSLRFEGLDRFGRIFGHILYQKFSIHPKAGGEQIEGNRVISQ
jgi:hypothetical protein